MIAFFTRSAFRVPVYDLRVLSFGFWVRVTCLSVLHNDGMGSRKRKWSKNESMPSRFADKAVKIRGTMNAEHGTVFKINP